MWCGICLLYGVCFSGQYFVCPYSVCTVSETFFIFISYKLSTFEAELPLHSSLVSFHVYIKAMNFYYVNYILITMVKKHDQVYDQALDFLILFHRASLRMKMERNTSTRSQSSPRCLRFPRGSSSSTPTSLVRRTSRSFRTLAGWGHIFLCLYDYDGKWWTLTDVQWENMLL